MPMLLSRALEADAGAGRIAGAVNVLVASKLWLGPAPLSIYTVLPAAMGPVAIAATVPNDPTATIRV